MNFSAQMQEPGDFCARTCTNIFICQSFIKRFMRISILAVAILLTSLTLLLATPGKCQDMTVEKVTVGLKQESLETAIRQIEQQTTLRFFYRKVEIKQLTNLNLPIERRTIEQTLYELLKNTQFSFRQIDQNILIKAGDQPIRVKRKVAGTVFTDDSKLPIKFAQVELLRKNDLQLVGQGSTDTLGRFELTTTDSSALLLRVLLLGYHLFSTEINNTENLVLPAIHLKPDVKELKEVIIAASSPLVRQEVDRLTYDVQADPESKINSLLDMLRKVPLVSVDADDNVKLKGSSSFKVLIDGHASSLVVNDPKEVFRSMAASNILRIEVITIPPAKYDSEGLAGIINIVTVKKINDGYSGNAGISYKFPNGPRSNASINLKSGKFGLSAYAGLSEYNIPQTSYSNFRQSNIPAQTINQDGTAHTNSKLGYVSTQMSYEIDSLNLISAIIGYNGGSSNRYGSVLTQQTDSLLHTYRLDNSGHNKQHGYDLGLDYQLGFKRNKAQLLSFSYRYSDNSSNQFNSLNASEQVNSNLNDYTQDNQSGTHEHTIQVDYTHPLKYIEIEGGVKAILRNNFSNYNVDSVDPVSGDISSDLNNSNQFTYQQNVYSIYNSYQLNLSKWTVKAGLRLESTDVQANFSLGGAVSIPGYNNLIPSIAVQRKFTQFESINFGYTERIQRPGISQLNPYVDQQNPEFITYGNPGLKPETNHIISFNYSLFKNTNINAGLSYSFSNNTIQYVSSLNTDGITTGTYKNLGTNNNLEADVNFNYPISNTVSLSFNGQVSYVAFKGMVDTVFYSRKAVIGNCNLSVSYKLDNDWHTGFNFQYYSPAITLQGTSSPYYYTSVSVSKSIFHKKLSLSGSVSNPYLKYLDYKYTSTDPRFTQISHNDIVYRRFNIGVNYRFGKLRDGSIKKNKKSVENNDIKIIPSIIPNN
jgi:Outer membrane protein beta-barrel family